MILNKPGHSNAVPVWNNRPVGCNSLRRLHRTRRYYVSPNVRRKDSLCGTHSVRYATSDAQICAPLNE